MNDDNRSSGVDGTPSAALDVAFEAIREAIHLTRGRSLHPGSGGGWEYPSDVYLCVGVLTDIAAGLTQTIEQLSAALGEQYRAGQLSLDADDTWEGNSRAAFAAAFDSFATAARHAHLMGTALQAAHTIAGSAEYTPTPPQP